MPELSDFARTVIPNSGIKTPKNPFEALDLYIFISSRKDRSVFTKTFHIDVIIKREAFSWEGRCGKGI